MPAPYSSGAVFLSYAREDIDAARRIADALRGFGLEVWFDQHELRGGDAWDAKIRSQIRECSLFIPIVSAHSQSRPEGYFRREWKLAADRTSDIAHGVPFIVPVVTDDTTEAAALVPEEFMRAQWTRLPGGGPTPEFVGQVKRLLATRQSPSAPDQAATRRSSAAPEPANVSRRPRHGLIAAVGGLVAVAALVVAFLVWSRSDDQSIATAAPAAKSAAAAKAAAPPLPAEGVDRSIAVLPFSNLSEDGDKSAFFADGMHEELIGHLMKIPELRVISPQSVENYRATKKQVREIGQELNVGYLVQARVRRSGENVRVSAQLTDTRTEAQVWSNQYDRDLRDVFAIQSELAEVIAAALQVALSPAQRSLLARRPTDNPAAYDFYLQALKKLRLTRGNAQTDTLLEAALKLDPNFTSAWALLCYNRAWRYNVREPIDALRTKAEAARDAVIRLAPGSAEAFRAMGDFDYYCLGDYRRAEAHYKATLELLPNDPESLNQLRALARREGRWIDVVAYARASLEFDPGNAYVIRAGLVSPYVAGRHYAEAIQAQRRLVNLQPDDLNHTFVLAYLSFLAHGSTREIDELFGHWTERQANSLAGIRLRKIWSWQKGDLAEWDRIHAREQSTPPPTGLQYALLRAANGDLPRARELVQAQRMELRGKLQAEPNHALSWSTLAEIEALLGNTDEALKCARKGIELEPESHDALRGPGRSSSLAFVHAWTGDKERAIAEYARLLKTVYGGQNIHEMKRNPRYAPLRGDPRFEALINDPRNNAPLF